MTRRHYIAPLLASLAIVGGATAAPPNFEEHVGPILETWCVDCHRGSRGKNGVALHDHAATMKGGSAGAIVVPGDPGSSILYLVASHDRDPVMPPDGERLSDEELAIIRTWIEGGCRKDANDEGSGPKVAAMATLPRPAAGAEVMPAANSNPQPYWWHPRSDAIVAMDASPSSPLLAVGGQRQVTFYALESGTPLSCVPFPEGSVHDLRFSADGAVLVVAGGRGGASGSVALVDVAGGARLATIGGEPDVVLAADLSPDGLMLALGGPDGVVRVVDLASGDELHRLTPHTDWVTAIRFSPDGAMLATADRAGGAFVWEAWTGREFHRLPGLGSRATAITWRGDSNLVAFATDAGPIAVFGMERGDRIANQSLHGGTLAACFLPDGRLLTAGRDGRARIGDVGGGEVAGWPAIGDLATSVAASLDGSLVAVGGLDGVLRVQRVGETTTVAEFRADPPLAEVAVLAAAESAHAALTSERPPLEAAVGAANDALSAAQAAMATSSTESAKAEAVAVEAERTLADARGSVAALEAALAEPRRRKSESAEIHRELAERLASLDAEADRRRAEMRTAIETVSRLETEAVLANRSEAAAEEIAAARRLADGATALAQRAVAAAGDVRTMLDARSIESSTWTSVVEARMPALAAARESVQVAESAHATAAAARQAALDLLAVRRQELAAAEASAAGAREALETHSARLSDAAGRVDAAREALAARRTAVAESNGRVRNTDA